MVGLPGLGKTNRARSLAAEKDALRLTRDEWMIPLFAVPGVGGKRDMREGRFVWLAREALGQGLNAVADVVWGKGRALRPQGHGLRGRGRVAFGLSICLPSQPDERWRRLTARSAVSDGIATFAMTERDREANEAELQSSDPGLPPAGGGPWTLARWPTSLPAQ